MGRIDRPLCQFYGVEFVESEFEAACSAASDARDRARAILDAAGLTAAVVRSLGVLAIVPTRCPEGLPIEPQFRPVVLEPLTRVGGL